MPENTNPQVVAFANDRVRPIADRLYSAYFAAKSVSQDYNAGDIGTKINDAGAGNIIADGSETDGRTRITGGDIYNMMTLLEAYLAFVEGASVATAARLDVLSKPHVNKIAE